MQMDQQETICIYACAHIISPNFPSGYSKNLKASWNIVTSAGTYIALTFLSFDVYEDPLLPCSHDMVPVFDVNLIGKRSVIGIYCNSFLPPKIIKSSWNKMKISFSTDATGNGRGFHAKYEEKMYTPFINITDANSTATFGT